MSAIKECSFFLLNSNLVFIAVIALSYDVLALILIYFTNSFLILGICTFFMFSNFVKLSRYCRFMNHIFLVQNKAQLIIFKSSRKYIAVLYRFDNTFSKNLIEFFNFVFKCRFYVVFLVVFDFLYNDPV